MDGEVWAIGADSKVYQRANGRWVDRTAAPASGAWQSVEGILKSIVVDTHGKPWLSDARGQTFRYDHSSWFRESRHGEAPV